MSPNPKWWCGVKRVLRVSETTPLYSKTSQLDMLPTDLTRSKITATANAFISSTTIFTIHFPVSWSIVCRPKSVTILGPAMSYVHPIVSTSTHLLSTQLWQQERNEWQNSRCWQACWNTGIAWIGEKGLERPLTSFEAVKVGGASNAVVGGIT